MSKKITINKKFLENEVKKMLLERRGRNDQSWFQSIATLLWMLKGGNPYARMDPANRGTTADIMHIQDIAGQFEDGMKDLAKEAIMKPIRTWYEFNKKMYLSLYGTFEEVVENVERFVLYENDSILQAIREIEAGDTRYIPRIKNFFRIFNVKCNNDLILKGAGAFKHSPMMAPGFLHDPGYYCLNLKLEAKLTQFYKRRREIVKKDILKSNNSFSNRTKIYRRELNFLKDSLENAGLNAWK